MYPFSVPGLLSPCAALNLSQPFSVSVSLSSSSVQNPIVFLSPSSLLLSPRPQPLHLPHCVLSILFLLSHLVTRPLEHSVEFPLSQRRGQSELHTKRATLEHNPLSLPLSRPTHQPPLPLSLSLDLPFHFLPLTHYLPMKWSYTHIHVFETAHPHRHLHTHTHTHMPTHKCAHAHLHPHKRWRRDAHTFAHKMVCHSRSAFTFTLKTLLFWGHSQMWINITSPPSLF